MYFYIHPSDLGTKKRYSFNVKECPLPRKGELIKLEGQIFKVFSVMYYYDAKTSFGVLDPEIEVSVTNVKFV